VQGLLAGISEQGDYVYFVANGELAPGSSAGSCSANALGVPADAACNLYVAHRVGPDWTSRFIATLSGRDASDWGFAKAEVAAAPNLTATSSPTGRYIAFMSSLPLTGYDNRDALTGAADEEVFRYDAVLDELDCVSCNPTGGRPSGSVTESSIPPLSDPRGLWSGKPGSSEGKPLAAAVPEAQTPEQRGVASTHQPRVVLDNGRVFFNAFDALVPADSNRNWDAYEYEPEGTGGCGSMEPRTSVVSVPGGCLALLSSGASLNEVGILDASASGDDVFILTASRLAPEDVDRAYDIYDVHVCGSGWPCKAHPQEQVPCEGTACRLTGSTETDFAPGSAAINGRGNVRPHRRHHRRHRKRHRKHHHKAPHRRHPSPRYAGGAR
jgi:hypothetical protein